jgi:hypothetical protein
MNNMHLNAHNLHIKLQRTVKFTQFKVYILQINLILSNLQFIMNT